MAKLSVYQKAERALRLLLGLRSPHIAAAMRAHGFGDRDLAEGWALLRRLSVETLEGEAAPAPVGPGGGAGAPLRGLDAWENKWFAIASATLGRRVPEAKAWLFSNLSQASGLKVFFSVQVFVDRLERLGAPEAEGGLGRLGADVRALLAERGLNDAAIGEAKALLAELRRPEGGATPPRGGGPTGGGATWAEAEAALWAWCLEWGAVARAALHDRESLRQLGFLRTSAAGERGAGLKGQRGAGGGGEERGAGPKGQRGAGGGGEERGAGLKGQRGAGGGGAKGGGARQARGGRRKAAPAFDGRGGRRGLSWAGMYTAYVAGTPNGRKITILLEEMGVPYEVRRVDLKHGEQNEASFRALNPNGKIPVLVDDEGPGGKPVTIFESGAIMIYLAEKEESPLLPAEGAERYATLQWLMVQLAGVGPMFAQYGHFTHGAPERLEYAVGRYHDEVRRLYGVLDVQLGRGDFLAGDAYSIADVATYPWAHAHEYLKVDLEPYPNVRHWLEAVGARPAVQKGMRAV